MREATYYTLAALLEGPSHGYAILERVKAMTGGAVSLTTGTLYGTLDRLDEQGLIRRTTTEIVKGRARQYFEITEKGSGAVQTEAERMAQAASAVQSRVQAKRRRVRPAPGIPARGRSLRDLQP
ncbi:MAG: PadR family transcriptional regulator [Acidimicrobiales bacterium]